MDDEFKLCWKNFQDNIASGFQSLYDRGDLVDVTLACDGKLLQAHKIVLAICSPYFQEIFTTNPCQHPIIILKDVSFNIMCELLEFMYQGVVNVKHTELQSFMKIGQLLQIKGLATNSNPSPGSCSSEKSTSQTQNPSDETNAQTHNSTNSGSSNSSSSSNNNNNNNNNKTETDHNEPAQQSGNKASTHSNSRNSTASPGTGSTSSYGHNNNKSNAEHQQMYTLSKRHTEFNNDSLSIYSRKQLRRSLTDHLGSAVAGAGAEGSEHADASMEALSSDEYFLPPIPQISMGEARYDLVSGSVKRESDHHGSLAASSPSSSSSAAASLASLRNPFGPAFNLDYSFYKSNSNSSGVSGITGNNSGASIGGLNNNNGIAGSGVGSNNTTTEYPNELYMPNEYSKNFGNHMDIPPIAPGEHWFQGKLEFMLSQRGKPLLVHDGHTFGIQYVRKDKKYWQCNLSRKFNCKARVTTTDTGEIIVTNNEHCHTEIRQHLRKDYQRNKVMMNALINLSTNRFACHNFAGLGGRGLAPIPMPQTLAQSSSMDEVVQNLHDFAKASAEANEAAVAAAAVSQLQHQQQEQQQREQASLKQDNEEPLDCGIRSASLAFEEMARNLKANKANNDTNNEVNLKLDDWKCKLDSADVH